jgi:hypothetical protein
MEPVRPLRRYRVTVGRTLMIEVEGDGDERAARLRAAKALIEDLARSPLSVTDALVEPVSPEETVQPDELHDTVEL